MNSKNKVYILERFENFGTIEDKDIYRHVDGGTYSIEHIMPQHLTPAWVEDLGADYEEIHTLWLHRLANLTLTAYNAKYSNSSFKEKRDMTNGFRESGLRMNTWIAQQEKWTLAELEKRNEKLVQRGLEIWAMPATEYKPTQKQLDSFTLDDDVDLSGREIARFGYRNTEQPVSSWITMMEQILKILHDEDRSVLTVLAHTYDVENDLVAYVSNDPTKLRAALEIDNGIYLERNTSTSTKISVLRKLFKAYGKNPEDLVFYLKEASEDKTAEEAGTRYELRRRYWAFALDYIKAAHGSDGAFSNVNPSKENWISGFFGISGFNISCVANQDESRVELVLAKMDKLLNKSAYDYLYARRAKIESELGASLNWLRSDETKTSYVSCKLTDVSIANETDWLQMAKFHAEWSKKLYDILVPYLKNWNAQTGDNQ